MHIDRTTAKEAVRLLKNYRELIETSKALAEIFGRIRAKCADMAKDEKDANGREHMPAGTPAGGQFMGKGGGGGTVTTPEERRKKIESVKIDFDRDNILPELNKEDLALYKKESKPVLLKKGVIDRNEQQHPDIIREGINKLIGETLYDSDENFPTTNTKYNTGYYSFSKHNEASNSIVLIELSDEKECYEIVHYFRLNLKKYEKLKSRNR